MNTNENTVKMNILLGLLKPYAALQTWHQQPMPRHHFLILPGQRIFWAVNRKTLTDLMAISKVALY
jgi:hypothetical protein